MVASTVFTSGKGVRRSQQGFHLFRLLYAMAPFQLGLGDFDFSLSTVQTNHYLPESGGSNSGVAGEVGGGTSLILDLLKLVVQLLQHLSIPFFLVAEQGFYEKVEQGQVGGHRINQLIDHVQEGAGDVCFFYREHGAQGIILSVL